MRFIVCLSALALGCSGDGESAGGKGQPCRPDGSCDAGLVCLASVCVDNPDSGWRDLFVPLPDHRVIQPDLPPAADGPLADGKAPPKPDLKLPAPDTKLPTPDKGAPASCALWSSWSCIKAPRYGVVCWATCPGGKGAIWCDGGGNCYCTAKSGNCATGVPINLSQPCAACQVALEAHGCCQ